jgi:hypothetical protein
MELDREGASYQFNISMTSSLAYINLDLYYAHHARGDKPAHQK